jgi:hypothetical protein
LDARRIARARRQQTAQAMTLSEGFSTVGSRASIGFVMAISSRPTRPADRGALRRTMTADRMARVPRSGDATGKIEEDRSVDQRPLIGGRSLP